MLRCFPRSKTSFSYNKTARLPIAGLTSDGAKIAKKTICTKCFCDFLVKSTIIPEFIVNLGIMCAGRRGKFIKVTKRVVEKHTF